MRKTELSPSTAWSEKIAPGEEELFKRFSNYVIAAQQKEFAGQFNGRLQRGFHAKPHAGVVAEFKVLDGLPDFARFGVFSEPRTFPAVVRFSNGTPQRQSDTSREPRGIGIKLIGVTGDKMPPGNKDDITQDFLATSHSVTSTVRDAKQFIAFIESRSNGGFPPIKLARAVGVRETVRILFALATTVGLSRVHSVATEHYAGTAPIRLGPYAVKLTVRPPEGTKKPSHRPRTPDFLREELTERLREGDIMFDFVLQFYVDDEHTPIEDTSVRWKPKYAPFVKVAELRIPSCDLAECQIKERSDRIERFAFSPWHTIAEHQPLGNVMRARRIAYQASASLRGSCPEPTRLPD